MGYRSIANRLAEHTPMLGSVSSRPGLAAYCGAGLVDFVRPAGSLRPVLASADTAQRNSLSQRFFFYVEIDYLHPSPLERRLRTSSFATREVNDVSILLCNHGANRCRGGLYRRAGSVGRESVSQEPSRRSPAELRGKEKSKCRQTRLTIRK
jgi:hypothetical protein